MDVGELRDVKFDQGKSLGGGQLLKIFVTDNEASGYVNASVELSVRYSGII